MEIPGTKRFIPKGFESGATMSQPICSILFLQLCIVNRGDWFGSSANIRVNRGDRSKFRFESPRPCTIVCFTLIHYA